MEWIKDVQKAIHYIEENLLREIGAEDVSQYVHASKDHFQKVFFIVTGLTVGEYVRNRRLSRAGEEIAAGGAKVIEVALRYQYETPESFTKAFSRFHGVVPSAIRAKSQPPVRFDPLTIQIQVKGGFAMSRKMITRIPLRQLTSMNLGQNYWLNGCLDFLMECLDEDRAYDYWFFSGVTGDSFTQVFSKRPEKMVLCYSDAETEMALQKAFSACGYDYAYFKNIQDADRAELNGRIRAYIDRSIPVIARLGDAFHSFAIICGYDEDEFYYILGEETEPKPYRYEELIFVGDKVARPSLAEAYHKAVMDIPMMTTMPDTAMCSFGKKAFTDWAESFQNGMYDHISVDDKVWYTHGEGSTFSCWNQHGTYLCMLGTNGCANGFLTEALKLNPDMAFLERLMPIYQKLNGDGFMTLIDMEGGFELRPEVLKDKERMKPICEGIMKVAGYCDDVMEVFAGLA